MSSSHACAQCYTIANSFSNDPFRQCLSQCQHVNLPTLKCIQTAVANNALVLPEHMDCQVNPVRAREVEPGSECKTLCLAAYNNCLNQPSSTSCVPAFQTCKSQCQ